MMRRYYLAIVLCLATGHLLTTTGCSRKPGKSDLQVAKEALNLSLTSWKNGKSPTDLKSESKVIVGDCVWESGVKLVDFQIDDSPEDDGRNFHFATRLSVLSRAGEVIQEQSSYIVATDPVVTVFRQDPLQ